MKTILLRLGQSAAVCGLLTLAALLAGCGRNGVTRLPLYGTVSHANGEKQNGTITFLPAEDRPGPAATTGLVDGEYHFDRNNGPSAGPHHVIIRRPPSKEAAMKALAGNNPSAMGPTGKDEWTRSADVPADGPYRLDFTLSD